MTETLSGPAIIRHRTTTQEMVVGYDLYLAEHAGRYANWMLSPRDPRMGFDAHPTRRGKEADYLEGKHV